jgi:hypothetical protein
VTPVLGAPPPLPEAVVAPEVLAAALPVLVLLLLPQPIEIATLAVAVQANKIKHR